MKWTIEYLEKDRIVYMKTFGPSDWEENRQMCEKALAVGRSNGSHRFLVDHRNLEHGLSTLQVDDLPGMLKQIGVDAQDKIALVFDPSSPISESFSFFRDSAFLESLRVRNFTDPDKAIAWLETVPSDKPEK
jgi:hypothetical protein